MSLLNFFEKIAHVSGLSVCVFLALCVWMCVAGTNKVEDTIS